MGKRKPRPKPTPPPRRSARRLLAVVFTVLLAAGLLASLGWLGQFARDHLGPRDRYRTSFTQIECDVPHGMNRDTFLAEVRYVGNCPDEFQLLDPELSTKLTAAFAAHPWIESVEGVELEPASRVLVRLRFRTPVMAVKIQTGAVRLVDRHGILLPVRDVPSDTPELIADVPEPKVASGKVWPDPTVIRAVELVETYHPRRLEKRANGWKLTGSDGLVLEVNR